MEPQSLPGITVSGMVPVDHYSLLPRTGGRPANILCADASDCPGFGGNDDQLVPQPLLTI